MTRCALFALLAGLLVLSGGVVGQDNKPKQEPKKADVKDEPPARVKGRLPANWSKIGLSDSQVQSIYRVQNKYNDEISKLKAKIKDLEAKRDTESKAILTPEQKKRLEEILLKR